MKLTKNIFAFAAVLGAVTVGSSAAASAASPVPVAPKTTIKQLPAPSMGPAAGSCNAATQFWFVYPSTTVVVPTLNGSTNCILGPGNQGTAVYWLQASLINCNGVSTNGHDGIYGPGTRDAVLHVQRKAGIGQDGVYGPNTRRAMSWTVYRASDGRAVGCGKII